MVLVSTEAGCIISVSDTIKVMESTQQQSPQPDRNHQGESSPLGSDRPITLSLIILVILLGAILLVGWILSRAGIDERPAPTPESNRAGETQQEQGFAAELYQNAQSQVQTPTSNPVGETFENSFE